MADYFPSNNEEEIEVQVFTIQYEDGTSADCAIMARFELEEDETGESREYVAVTELIDGELPEDNLEIMFFRYFQDPEDENSFTLDDITDEDEQQIVQAAFQQIMEDEDEEEEDFDIEEPSDSYDDDERMIQDMVDRILNKK